MALLTLGARLRILLVDRFSPLQEGSAPKLCGGLLTSVAQQLLPGEPPKDVRAEPWRTRLEFHDLNARRIWAYDVDYVNCYRGKLDRWLLGEALGIAKSATYEQRTQIIGLQPGSRGWRAQLIHHPSGQREEVEAQFVIDASGWREVSRRLLGRELAPRLNAFQLTGAVTGQRSRNFFAVFDSRQTPFYGWFIPKGEMAELGAAFPLDRRWEDPARFLAPFQTYLARRGIEFEGKTAVRGCPLTYIRRRSDIWTGNASLLVAGEAAGLVSPSSGDGISYALASGKAAAEAILAADSQVSQGKPDESLAPQNGLMPAATEGESVQTDYRRRLKPYLRELYFNIRKARWLAHPRTRRWLSCLLPLARNRHPERLPFL